MVVERANQFMDVEAPSSELWCIGVPNPWVDVETVSLSPHRDISKALEKWIQWKMSDTATASQLAAVTAEATDSEPGIREFDVEDRDAVEEWMNMGSELMLVRRILEVSHLLDRTGFAITHSIDSESMSKWDPLRTPQLTWELPLSTSKHKSKP
jgi:hypothetical protein